MVNPLTASRQKNKNKDFKILAIVTALIYLSADNTDVLLHLLKSIPCENVWVLDTPVHHHLSGHMYHASRSCNNWTIHRRKEKREQERLVSRSCCQGAVGEVKKEKYILIRCSSRPL